VPEHEDLVRRALGAGKTAALRRSDSRRIIGFAQVLRDARAGRVFLVRCAWCDRFEVEGEWLHLHAIGRGQQQIASSLRDRVTHGICPDCIRRLREAGLSR
jgi:hypothetical protein